MGSIIDKKNVSFYLQLAGAAKMISAENQPYSSIDKGMEILDTIALRSGEDKAFSDVVKSLKTNSPQEDPKERANRLRNFALGIQDAVMLLFRSMNPMLGLLPTTPPKESDLNEYGGPPAPPVPERPKDEILTNIKKQEPSQSFNDFYK